MNRMSALKNHSRGVGRGICGGVGSAHTPTYTVPRLSVDLFSVDSPDRMRLNRSDHVHERSVRGQRDFEALVSRKGWLGGLQPYVH